MGIFGLGASNQKKSAKGKKSAPKGKQDAAAKAVLKKMQAKKDAGDCAFC